MASPDQLVRVVAGPDGGLVVGRTALGRGAWLCADSPACLDAAGRRRAFDRALRTTLDGQAVEGLRTTLSARGRLDG